jgi:hypothetical protein
MEMAAKIVGVIRAQIHIVTRGLSHIIPKQTMLHAKAKIALQTTASTTRSMVKPCSDPKKRRKVRSA